jgi:hypothetical protein
MNVLMPQLGETVAEGTIAVWHKKVGDTVGRFTITSHRSFPEFDYFLSAH